MEHATSTIRVPGMSLHAENQHTQTYVDTILEQFTTESVGSGNGTAPSSGMTGTEIPITSPFPGWVKFVILSAGDKHEYNLIFGAIWLTFSVVSLAQSTLLLLIGRSIRVTSHGVYLIGLGLAEWVLLLLRCVTGTLMVTPSLNASLGRNLARRSTSYTYLSVAAACGVVGLQRCLETARSWLYVSLATDRSLSIMFPMKRLKICTASRARLVTVVVYGFSFATYLGPVCLAVYHSVKIQIPAFGRSLLLGRPLNACPLLQDWWLVKTAYFQHLVTWWIPIGTLCLASVLLLVQVRIRSNGLKNLEHSVEFMETIKRMKKSNRLSLCLVYVFIQFTFLQLPSSVGGWLLKDYVMQHDVGMLQNPGKDILRLNRLTVIAKICETLEILSQGLSLPLMLTNVDIRRNLYHVICPRRVTIGAMLSRGGTRSRQNAGKRLDPLAKTRHRPVVALRMNSMSDLPSPTVCTLGDSLTSQGASVTSPSALQKEAPPGSPFIVPNTMAVLKATALRLSDMESVIQT